jgi:hypothetical protein
MKIRVGDAARLVMDMPVLGFEAFLEAALQTVIDKCYPLTWKENSITENLGIEIRSSFKTISLVGFPVSSDSCMGILQA